jgi:hypothetical protein
MAMKVLTMLVLASVLGMSSEQAAIPALADLLACYACP